MLSLKIDRAKQDAFINRLRGVPARYPQQAGTDGKEGSYAPVPASAPVPAFQQQQHSPPEVPYLTKALSNRRLQALLAADSLAFSGIKALSGAGAGAGAGAVFDNKGDNLNEDGNLVLLHLDAFCRRYLWDTEANGGQITTAGVHNSSILQRRYQAARARSESARQRLVRSCHDSERWQRLQGQVRELQKTLCLS